MGYFLNNKLEVSLFIDNVEYNLAFNNVLNFLHMSSSVIQQVPTMHFSITDTNSDILQFGIPDGIPIRAVIKSAGSNDSKVYTFRKFHSTKQLQNGIYTYNVDCYWDSVLYWAGTTCTGLLGNSNDVLSQIATTCGLKYSGTTTNDNQTWLQQNDTYGMFAKTIRKHGYIDNASCMSLGLDLNGTLIYSNLNGKPSSPPIPIVAYQRSDTAITAIDYHVMQTSGFNNQLTGYSLGLVVQSIVPALKVNAALPSPIDSVAISNTTDAINLHSAEATTINNKLINNFAALPSKLANANLLDSQTALNHVLFNNADVINNTNFLNSSVNNAIKLSSTLGPIQAAIITNSGAIINAGTATINATSAQIVQAEILVSKAVDATSLAAAITAVNNITKINIETSGNLNLPSVASTISGSLKSAITDISDSAAVSNITAMGAATVSDVISAANSANTLASNAISLAATASTAAATAGIATAASGLTPESMASSTSSIVVAINKALNQAVTQVEKLISDEVTSLAKKAAFILPTFGPTSQGATSTPVDSVVFTSDVKAPLLNTTVKAKAKRGAYIFSGIDSGNTHETYDQAGYQNTRYSNLFSLKLEILLDTPSSIPLLSTINFSVTDINNSQSIAYSGLYTVISKAIYIQGVTYSEKLEVARHGTNDTYTVG